MKLIAVCLFFFAVDFIYAQETIEFNINGNMIEAVTYFASIDSTFSLSIRLSREASKEFENITENNVGKLLKVFKSDHKLIGAIIKAKIPNGRILLSDIKDKKEVIRLLKILIE